MAKKSEPVDERIKRELSKESPNYLLIESLSRQAQEGDTLVRFTVDASHVVRLGLELVGKQDTALSELIKNSFDADATEVRLDFRDQDTVGGHLTISDNGNGMSEEAIRENWMRISTAAKVIDPVSPRFNRIRAGRKGIGRFSAQRLGKRLTLETKAEGQRIGHRVEFNWDRDFKAGLELQNVFNSIKAFDKGIDDRGTSLFIDDLRDAWPQEAIESVWRSVFLLQPPFKPAPTRKAKSAQGDPGFNVFINDSSRGEQTSLFSVERTFLDQAIATIEASIAPSGRAKVTVKSRKLDLEDSQTLDEKYLIVGPVKLTAHYFIYERGSLSGMKQAESAELGRRFGGVRVYRNGFRVLPYGEEADDWLRLDGDVSRRKLLVPSNNRNLFGEVIVNSENNPFIEETSSREGLVENEAYTELRKFARNAIEWSVLRVAAARNRKQTAGQQGYTPPPKPPSEVLEGIRKQLIAFGAPPGSMLGRTEQFIVKAIEDSKNYEEKVEEERAASIEYEEMLRLLASLGLSISMFGHEVKGAREAIGARIEVLSNIVAKLSSKEDTSRLRDHIVGLRNDSKRLFDIGGYIAGVMSSTEARELRSVSVLGELENFIAQFADYMARQKLVFELKVDRPELRTTKLHAAEIESVLLNFLTNSIKSINRKQPTVRKIRIDARQVGDHIVIGFEDNGEGVSEDIADRIFDAFFTTTGTIEEDGVAGPGTGLGLKIVSDIAHSYGGSVALTEPSAGYTCRFEFRVLAAEKDI